MDGAASPSDQSKQYLDAEGFSSRVYLRGVAGYYSKG